MFRVLPLLAFAAIALLTATGRASLYQPEDPIVIPVASDGTGRDIPFDDFEKRFSTRVLELNPVFKDTKGENKAREVILQRIAQRRRVANRSSLENAALAADLLRIGKPDDAESVLASDRRGFLPNITLAHICAVKGEWAKAAEYLSIANEERPPTELKGWSKAQLDWELKLDRGPLTRLFEARALEARAKIVPENEDVDAIFPVKFVNEAGKYEPGKVTGHLPPDAIAVVQQMLLWSPIDTRLYWLLGELYAAQGKFAEAKKIMDQCVSEARQYGNRKILMDHRTAVRAAAEVEARRTPDLEVTATPPADDTKPQPDKSVPFDLGAVWIYFGVVAVVVLLAVVRSITRKSKGRGDPRNRSTTGVVAMGSKPFPRWKQQLGGAVIAALGCGGTIWNWHTAISEGYFRVKASVLMPAFLVIGLALIALPGYKEERIARGEDISGLSGMQLVTPRWWTVLILALAAGVCNLLLLGAY